NSAPSTHPPPSPTPTLSLPDALPISNQLVHFGHQAFAIFFEPRIRATNYVLMSWAERRKHFAGFDHPCVVMSIAPVSGVEIRDGGRPFHSLAAGEQKRKIVIRIVGDFHRQGNSLLAKPHPHAVGADRQLGRGNDDGEPGLASSCYFLI